jgi:hypothetical protein
MDAEGSSSIDPTGGGMSENDVLVELLGSLENKTGRRSETVVELGNGDSNNASEYDLTNPNLHHGAGDLYRPVQSSEFLGASPSIVPTDAASAIAVESFVVGVQDDKGATAGVVTGQSADGQVYLPNTAIPSAAPLAIDTPAFSASLPASLSIDFPTGSISDVPTEGPIGGSSLKAAATDFQNTAIADNVVIDVAGTQTATPAVAATVDNAPVITSNGTGDSATLNVAENTTAVTTVTATDADAGSTLTYSIVGGEDAAKFTVDGSTGALSFVSAPDYEHPTDAGGNNVYDVTVQVSDAGGLTTTQSLAIGVTDVNEAPTGLQSHGAAVQEDVASGGTISAAFSSAGRLVATLVGTDPDSVHGDTLGYSIVGGDSSKYEILNGNEIHVRSGVTLNYETDATDSVTFRIVDSHGATYDQQFNIDVTNYTGSFSGTAAAETITGTSEEASSMHAAETM